MFRICKVIDKHDHATLLSQADAKLPPLQATTAVLTTLGHLLIRFETYQTYPTLLHRLSRQFNPTGYLSAILTFLSEPPERLDVGYGRPLHAEAWAQDGSEGGACTYLSSDLVQSELTQIFSAANASSLDVERKHAADKRCERSRETNKPMSGPLPNAPKNTPP